jgi:uncharacterized membrane protein (UPF0127 family)
MRQVLLQNQSKPGQAPITTRYCDSFLCRFRGLMLARSIAPREGLLMVQPSATRTDAAIHMLFMNFDIAVVWADDDLRVVDLCLARRWRPAYVPAAAARYVIELHPDRLGDFTPGDQLVLIPC